MNNAFFNNMHRTVIKNDYTNNIGRLVNALNNNLKVGEFLRAAAAESKSLRERKRIQSQIRKANYHIKQAMSCLGTSMDIILVEG